MRNEFIVKIAIVSLLIGILVTGLTITVNYMDDPIPPPGTSYRGIPVPWLKSRPMLGPKDHWDLKTIRATSTIRPFLLVLDVFFWTGCTYCLIVLPFRLRRNIRQSSRLRRGLCLSCGYNLAGNSTGVCPECGIPFGLTPKISTGGNPSQRDEGL